MGGDEELLAELAALFVENVAVQVESIRRAVAQGDGQRLFRTAHSLKGVLGNLCAHNAARAAQQLEEIGQINNLDNAAAIVELLEHEVDRFLAEVKKLVLEPSC